MLVLPSLAVNLPGGILNTVWLLEDQLVQCAFIKYYIVLGIYLLNAL
jgi:hypothetical protein